MPVLYAVKHDREPCHEKWGIKGPPAAVKTFNKYLNMECFFSGICAYGHKYMFA